MFLDPVEAFDSRESLLDAVESWNEETLDRERWTFICAAKFADMHSVDSTPSGTVLDGMERGVRPVARARRWCGSSLSPTSGSSSARAPGRPAR